MNANPRSFFITPAPRTDRAALESALRALGAERIEPARILPPRRILIDGFDEIEEILLSARMIYRADFPQGPTGGCRALAKVWGVARVRASLAYAPDGEDLPAAARPIPSAPKPPKVPPDPASRNTARKRWSRLTVGDTAAITQAFAVIGVEPSWQKGNGAWPGGFWTLSVRNAWDDKVYCLRLFCREQTEVDRLATVPGAVRAK